MGNLTPSRRRQRFFSEKAAPALREAKNFYAYGARRRIEPRQRRKSLLLLFFRKEGLPSIRRPGNVSTASNGRILPVGPPSRGRTGCDRRRAVPQSRPSGDGAEEVIGNAPQSVAETMRALVPAWNSLAIATACAVWAIHRRALSVNIVGSGIPPVVAQKPPAAADWQRRRLDFRPHPQCRPSASVFFARRPSRRVVEREWKRNHPISLYPHQGPSPLPQKDHNSALRPFWPFEAKVQPLDSGH